VRGDDFKRRLLVQDEAATESYWIRDLSDRGLVEEFRFSTQGNQDKLRQYREDLGEVHDALHDIQQEIDSQLSQGDDLGMSIFAEEEHRWQPYHSSGGFQLTALESRLWALISKLQSTMFSQLSSPIRVGLRIESTTNLQTHPASSVELGDGISVDQQVQDFLSTSKEDFDRLADEWERNRPQGVDLADMVMHSAYQQIIGIGPQAIPWLLDRLEERPGHWFWALNSITRDESVVPEESHGNLNKMAEAWLNWGSRHGFVQ